MTAPFDDPITSRSLAEPTVANLLDRIAADPDLPDWKRRDLRSSLLRVICHARRAPGSTPATITTIMALAEEVLASMPVSPKRRANILSDLRFIGQRYGLISGNEWRKLPPSPSWQALLEPVTDKYDRGVLLPFARFCSSIGVEPGQVTDEAAARYRTALAALGRVEKKARTDHQTLCRRWNALASRPTPPLQVPCYRTWYCFPDEDFPASLWEDLETYLVRLGTDNLLDLDSPPKPLRPQSIEAHRYWLRYYASTLVHAGEPPEALTSLAALVASDRFERAAEYLYAQSNQQPSKHFSLVLWGVHGMARHYLKLPDERIASVARICGMLTPRISGMTRKNRRRLAEATSPEVLDRLLAYPVDEMQRIEKRDDGSYRTALRYQRALAIELLLHALVRIRNLAGLHLDHHLLGLDREQAYIDLSEEDMKNEQAMLIPLPAHLKHHINFYVQHLRPRFNPGDSCFLFPGRGRPDKRTDTLGRQIAKTTEREIGVRLNAHLFRHLGAHLKLTDRPGDYGGTSRVLGHKSMNTAYKSYTGLEDTAAFRHIEEIIAARRAQGYGRPRRRR